MNPALPKEENDNRRKSGVNPALPKEENANRRKSGVKAIFIDRDGVINKDPGGWTQHSYVTDWEDFHFLPGALEALRLLNKNGIKVMIVSNQAGISKGYFSKKSLDYINSRMLDEINKNGGKIEESFYCTHRDEDNCGCRKPKAGLLEMAAKKYDIDTRENYIIGDSQADIVAGSKIGLKTILVLSGKVSLRAMEEWDEKPDRVFKDLLEAVEWILSRSGMKTNNAFGERGKR